MDRKIPKRRLTDMLRALFHESCNQGDTVFSERLLNLLIKQVMLPPDLTGSIDRRKPEDMAGPCERLANLQLHGERAEANDADRPQ
jgi:hypothetical protein